MGELADAEAEQRRDGFGAFFPATVRYDPLIDRSDLVGEGGQHRKLTRGVEVSVVGEPVQSGAEVLRVGAELPIAERLTASRAGEPRPPSQLRGLARSN